MSVIPLSIAIQDGLVADVDREPDTTPVEKPGAINDSKLDSVIDAALVNYREDDPPPDKRDLDTMLDQNLDRYYQGEADKAAFDASKDSRSELQRRYAAQGGDIAETLSRFIGFHKAAQQDPRGASLALAESYARLSPYSLTTDKPAAEQVEVYVDGTGTRHTGKKLSAIIEDAIDNAGREKKDFVATAQQRAELKAAFPDLTFDQAVARILRIDTDLRADPIGVSAQIATAYGMPWNARQEADHAENNRILGHVDAAATQGIDVDRVLSVVQNPAFVKSGDPVQDLHRARAVAEHLHAQDTQMQNYIDAEKTRIGPALQAMIEHVTFNKDPEYQQQPFCNPAGCCGS